MSDNSSDLISVAQDENNDHSQPVTNNEQPTFAEASVGKASNGQPVLSAGHYPFEIAN
jgi:hypothetical protein